MKPARVIELTPEQEYRLGSVGSRRVRERLEEIAGHIRGNWDALGVDVCVSAELQVASDGMVALDYQVRMVRVDTATCRRCGVVSRIHGLALRDTADPRDLLTRVARQMARQLVDAVLFEETTG